MAEKEASAHPGTAKAESGLVFIKGPEAVAATLTPEAAEKMARAMIVASRIAKRQRDTFQIAVRATESK